MTDASQSRPARPSFLWGPASAIGLTAALLTAVADQASKAWVLFGLDIAHRPPIALTRFLDIVIVWNRGISYGLFQQESAFGQWMLLGVKVVAVALLWVWLSRVTWRFTAVALGLIIGGAVGNAIDRFTYGAVADFVFFHITTATWSFNWYVFNLADAAIVAGVVGLLYESVASERAAKAP